MAKYVLRRLIQAVITLLGITLVCYLLMTIINGPLAVFGYIASKTTPPIFRGQTADSLPVEYLRWMLGEGLFPPPSIAADKQSMRTQHLGILRGDFGRGLGAAVTVGQTISSKLPYTLQILVTTLVLCLVVVLIMRLTHIKPPRSVGLMLSAVPIFWLPLVLCYIGAMVFQTFPPCLPGDPCETNRQYGILNPTVTLVLAALALTPIFLGSYFVFLDGIRKRIFSRDDLPARMLVFRPSARPFPSFFAPVIVNLICGVVFVEGTFQIPGLGRWVWTSTVRADPPSLLGSIISLSVLATFSYLGFDIIYKLLTLDRVNQGWKALSERILPKDEPSPVQSLSISMPESRDKVLRLAIGVLLIVTVITLLSPLINQFVLQQDPNTAANQLNLPPLTNGHLLGTDDLGRDVFARLLVGGQIPLLISLIASLISVGLALLLSFVSYREDNLFTIGVNGLTNIFSSIPVLPLIFVAILGLRQLATDPIVFIIILLGFVGSTAIIPVMRSKIRLWRQKTTSVSTENRPLAVLALIIGSSLAITIGNIFLIEAALSFVLFFNFDYESWGFTLRGMSEGMDYPPSAIQLFLPSLIIILIVFSLFIIGDRLRLRLDRVLAE